MSGDTAVVGARFGDGDSAVDSGSAYVFNLVCDPGYYGPMCLECPGGAGNPCSGHGTCDDGILGAGQCTCDAGWGGPECSEVLGTCCISNGSCETAGNCRENITPSA